MKNASMILETNHATLTISTEGIVLSLTEIPSGRQLSAAPIPFMAAELEDGTILYPQAILPDEALFKIQFAHGHIRMRLEAQPDYFFFSVAEIHIPNLKTLTFFRIQPTTTTYFGPMCGASTDDKSGICLRSLALESDFRKKDDVMELYTEAKTGLLSSGAMAAGARDTLLASLRAMTLNENIPSSDRGGAFSLGSPQTLGSYMFVDLTANRLGEWIELARRGGIAYFHIHAWWETWGHYDSCKFAYPRGFQQLKECADKIHAAGMKVGMHMLSGCINPEDSWINPEAPEDLINQYEYTLAEDIDDKSLEVPVLEEPGPGHALYYTYSGNGNVLRIGSELIKYDAIEGKRFTHCTRGAFGTRPASHSKGDFCGYIQQRYLAFYPKPDSPLAKALIQNIGAILHACKADMIYMDGSEGMRSRYGIDYMRKNIFLAVKPVIVESSHKGHNNWWFHSRLGARDLPAFAMKEFIDYHIKEAEIYRKAEFMEPQMGWWATLPAEITFRAGNPDDNEYLNLKSMLIDSPVAVRSVHHGRDFEIFTRTGWYERLRLAGYFDMPSLAPAKGDDIDCELRLLESGEWKLRRRFISRHVITSALPETAKIVFNNKHGAQPFAFRLEALTSCKPYDDKDSMLLADFAAKKPNVEKAAEGVEFKAFADGEWQGKNVFRIQAENHNAPKNGSWVRISHTYAPPHLNASGTRALGVWVKGDNSGAIVNFQIHTAREFSGVRADHYVRLNFTGWRYFTIPYRERSASQVHLYQWPYDPAEANFSIYHQALIDFRIAHTDEISVFLNDIPVNGRTDVSILPIRAMDVIQNDLPNPVLTLNGTTIPLGNGFRSIEAMESMGDGIATQFDKKSFPSRTILLPDGLQLKNGENTIEFSCGGHDGEEKRCELAVFTYGDDFGDKSKNAKMAEMAMEYTMPVPLTINAARPIQLIPRKDEPAPEVSFEFFAQQAPTPITGIKLTDGTLSFTFQGQLRERERLVLKGAKWSVSNAAGDIVSEGKLPASIAPLTAMRAATASIDFSDGQLVWASAIKHYPCPTDAK